MVIMILDRWPTLEVAPGSGDLSIRMLYIRMLYHTLKQNVDDTTPYFVHPLI